MTLILTVLFGMTALAQDVDDPNNQIGRNVPGKTEGGALAIGVTNYCPDCEFPTDTISRIGLANSGKGFQKRGTGGASGGSKGSSSGSAEGN